MDDPLLAELLSVGVAIEDCAQTEVSPEIKAGEIIAQMPRGMLYQFFEEQGEEGLRHLLLQLVSVQSVLMGQYSHWAAEKQVEGTGMIAGPFAHYCPASGEKLH